MTITIPITQPTLAILVPCFNESEVLSHSTQQLLLVLTDLIAKEKIAENSFIYFIDDGSTDNTWELITAQHHKHPQIKGLKLSRNFGQQKALYAGLMHIKDKIDCVISMDADLEDSILVIENFIDHFHQGFEVVYGVRKQRSFDGFFKKYSALLFYQLMKLLGTKIIPNHSDFRLTSKRVIYCLEQFAEFNLFLRGIFTLIGFKSCNVYYDRGLRTAGKSKYSFKKLLAYSIDGITAFSIAPLRLIALAGILFFISSTVMSSYILFAALIQHKTIPGWASTVLPIYFIGGVQLLSIGILGEYLGKVYQEAKARPRFIIDTEI